MPVLEEIPGPGEYCALRVAAGLSPKDEADAAESLPRSLFAVTVREERRLIGMGRVVGDLLHAQVVDVAVHPGRQGRGLGRAIMQRIVMFLVEEMPEDATISLFADVDGFYDEFGFRPPRHSPGLFFDRGLLES